MRALVLAGLLVCFGSAAAFAFSCTSDGERCASAACNDNPQTCEKDPDCYWYGPMQTCDIRPSRISLREMHALLEKHFPARSEDR